MKPCKKKQCLKKEAPSIGTSHPADKGMNWVRQDLRLALYLRDGLACMYCGQGIEAEVKLTLDHLHPWSHGGCNCPSNLVTCCQMCNSSRQDRSVEEFADSVASYLEAGVSGRNIVESIQKNVAQDISTFREEAKELISRRGSAAKVVAARFAAL